MGGYKKRAARQLFFYILVSYTVTVPSGGLVCVTGFLEKFEHILFICLNTGLVEGVHAQHIAADATCFLEEVDELSE